MLNDIITYLDLQLSNAGYLQKNWGFVERIYDGEKIYPAKYCQNGVHNQVSDFSKYTGVSYWRLNGEVSTIVQEHPRRSSAREITLTYPIKGVFAVRKKELPSDNEYSASALVTQLTKILTVKANSLKVTLKASRCDILETGHETRSGEVFAGEYSGVEDITLSPEYAYCYINFNIVVVVSRECIPELC